MIVVSDASPLHYLVLIGAEHCLATLFSEVVVPPMVLEELGRPRTPAIVRAFAARLPDWVKVRTPTRVDSTLQLDPGETQAIALAEELRVTLLLIDERRGALVAKTRGLRVMGALGVLELADERQLLALPSVVAKLRATNYRIAEAILVAALARSDARSRARRETK